MVRQYSQKLEFEHLIIKEVVNALVLQLLVRCEEQTHDLHSGFIGKPELAVGVCAFPRFWSLCIRSSSGPLVEPVVFVQYADHLRSRWTEPNGTNPT